MSMLLICLYINLRICDTTDGKSSFELVEYLLVRYNVSLSITNVSRKIITLSLSCRVIIRVVVDIIAFTMLTTEM